MGGWESVGSEHLRGVTYLEASCGSESQKLRMFQLEKAPQGPLSMRPSDIHGETEAQWGPSDLPSQGLLLGGHVLRSQDCGCEPGQTTVL